MVTIEQQAGRHGTAPPQSQPFVRLERYHRQAVMERIFPMAAEDMDLGAVIAALEAKRAALDNAIASLRVLVSDTMNMADNLTIVNATAISGSGEVPDGAFHGKSMPAAIRLYLEMVRTKKTAREISDGLKKGGLESTSKFFDKIVYSTLDRLRKANEVVKIGNAWGLPAWFPALMRAGAGVKSTKPRRGRPRKEASQGPKLLAAGANAKPQRRSLKSEPGPGDMIDWFLRDNPGPHTSEAIRTATKINNLRVTEMLLGRMVKRGKVSKTEDGKYRKAS
jgi:hypothetical protein